MSGRAEVDAADHLLGTSVQVADRERVAVHVEVAVAEAKPLLGAVAQERIVGHGHARVIEHGVQQLHTAYGHSFVADGAHAVKSLATERQPLGEAEDRLGVDHERCAV